MYSLVLLSFSIIGFSIYIRYQHTPPPGLRSAPGPKGSPILGNTHQLGAQPHQQIRAWARTYGDLYKIRLGWNDWYMICSPTACKEILDRQSAYTSSRPSLPVASDALSGGMRFLFMQYGPAWRKLRAASHRLLTPAMSATFKPSQEYEAKMLCEEILRGSDEKKGNGISYQAIRRYTVSVIMTSTYGKRIPEWNCEEIRRIYSVMSDFSVIAKPGAYIADMLPFLGALPTCLQWWRKPLQPYFDKQASLWMSFLTSLKDISELQAAFLAGSMIEAGSETTSAALNTAILYLSAYPDARRKAHEELDRVVGISRSPSFLDEKDLPYIRAVVKETLRLRPITNMGTPHYTTAPISYNNIHIPANSVVCLQQYPIHYDPTLFPDPEAFKPDRFLAYPHGSGHYAAGVVEARDHWAFGAGRRICSGIHLAENSMFIVLAKLLWAFDILPPAGVGRVDTSDEAFDAQGSVTMANLYKVRWVPRSELAKNMVMKEAEDARCDGYVLRGVKVNEGGVEA